jgi:hypothetical protein
MNTLDHHRQRIRQLELRLHIADYGMGMPRDFATVLMLTAELANARKELAAAEAAANDNNRNEGYDITDSDYDEQMGGY